MRIRLALAVAAILAASAPALAQTVQLPAVIPAANQWRDIPTLAPAVTEPEMRARMNAEIAQAITQGNGDDAATRAAITVIVNRYQTNALPQNARTRPAPK